MPATQKKTGTGKAKPTSAKGKAAPKSGSQSTTKRKTKPPKKPPIYREVGAVICLLLAIFSALGYFNSQAIFINGLATLEKGLFGFGFWLMPVMLLLISVKLFRHFGRPVRLQIVLCLLVPLFVGAAVHTALCEGDYALKTSVLPALWESGAALSSGGALSGMLSVLLTKVFSSVGAMILLLLGLLCCVLGLRRIGPTELVHMLNEYRAQRYREKKKKAKEIKAKQVKVVIKEIRFGPQTDDHDYNFKLKHAQNFLKEGAKVKAYVFFRGRSIVFKEQGEILLLRFATDLEELAKVEMMPKLDGKKMNMILAPKNTKK